jgi:hypothetical protein
MKYDIMDRADQLSVEGFEKNMVSYNQVYFNRFISKQIDLRAKIHKCQHMAYKDDI